MWMCSDLTHIHETGDLCIAYTLHMYCISQTMQNSMHVVTSM